MLPSLTGAARASLLRVDERRKRGEPEPLTRGGRRAASNPPQEDLGSDAVRRPRASDSPRATRRLVAPSRTAGCSAIEARYQRRNNLPCIDGTFNSGFGLEVGVGLLEQFPDIGLGENALTHQSINKRHKDSTCG